LNLIAGRDHRGVRRAEFHFTEHTATQTQIGARAITSRWFKREYGLRQLYIFNLTVFEFDCRRVDVTRCSFDATVANYKAHSGDVDAAGLRAREVGGADLQFLDGDVRDTAATVGFDIFRRDAVDRRF